jgi:glycosyltransferase involved in cell wall biosynthesis
MSKQLHIAHYTNTYYPVISGVVRSVSTFRRALTDLGHNVFIFAQQSSDYEDQEPFIFRYPSVELPLTSGFPITIPISPFIDKLLPYLKLNVIHSHHPFLLGQTAVRKAAELGLPLVFTFHTRYRDYSHYVSLSQEFIKEAISRWLGEYIQQCHHLVVPSESIQQMVYEDYGITERVSVVPTGIDLAPYQQINRQAARHQHNWGDDMVLISVGRLAKEKNWETLLAGVATAIKGRDKIRLVIIGNGDDREDLEIYASDLGIGEQVEFVGHVPFEDIPRYLCAADLFCFASTTETQGLVTMEALAARLPVVAVNASGTRDVIENDHDGFLTLNDPDALGRAIARMISDVDLRERFRAAAWQKAQTFETKLQAQKLVAVYEQAIEDYQAGRYVTVDEQKEVFSLMSEEQWSQFTNPDHPIQ